MYKDMHTKSIISVYLHEGQRKAEYKRGGETVLGVCVRACVCMYVCTCARAHACMYKCMHT